MKRFKESHPNYNTYQSARYCTDQVPANFTDGVIGLIAKHASDEGYLRSVVDDVRAAIPQSPTNNSGWSWLNDDLWSAFRKLEKSSFSKYMDGLTAAIDNLGSEFGSDLNEFIEETNFGYEILYYKSLTNREWALRDESTHSVLDSIAETHDTLPDYFQSTIDHLKAAADQVSKGDNERAWKNALRDAVSASEALYKSLSGEDDIGAAYSRLKESGQWGNVEILKEGFTIYRQVNSKYVDVRHGHHKNSGLQQAEAYYLIDRLLAWIRYMNRITPD